MKIRGRFVWAGVIGLLVAYAAITLTASLHKGLSFDEGEEIAIGYNLWLRHDFRMEAANGDLVKRWATLPLLVSKPHFPGTDDPFWQRGESYPVAFQFFFQCGNQPENLLLAARAMTVILGVATGLLVFFCSREIFGDAGGLVSLALFAFSRNMLAFGGLVSTEMSVCLALTGSTWFIWLLLHRITWSRLLGSLMFVALLVLSKPTALLIVPITAILVTVTMIAGRPLEFQLGVRRAIRSRAAQAGIFGAITLIHACVAWGALWADYDFRYAASPRPSDPMIQFETEPVVDPISPEARTILRWSRRTHFLPQGYLHGVRLLLGSNDERQAFMDGRWKLGGWRSFFPRAFWLKSSIAFPLLVLLGFGSWWWLRRQDRVLPPDPPGSPGRHPAPSFFSAIPFTTLIGVYMAAAIIQNINIGHRHILPIYPAIIVLMGSLGLAWAIRAVWVRAIVSLALVWIVVMTCWSYPDYLAYFNPAAGGSAQGYKHLVDSSLDWGMDLPGLRHWLDQHNPGNQEPLFLAYFGTDNPYYYGIKCRLLPCNPDWHRRDPILLTPGLYAISATLLQSVGTVTFGPWNRRYEQLYQDGLKHLDVFKRMAGGQFPSRGGALAGLPYAAWLRRYRDFDALRFARLCAWLRHHRDPDGDAGHSILIWNLDAAELNDALHGPPAELAAAPVTG